MTVKRPKVNRWELLNSAAASATASATASSSASASASTSVFAAEMALTSGVCLLSFVVINFLPDPTGWPSRASVSH